MGQLLEGALSRVGKHTAKVVLSHWSPPKNPCGASMPHSKATWGPNEQGVSVCGHKQKLRFP